MRIGTGEGERRRVVVHGTGVDPDESCFTRERARHRHTRCYGSGRFKEDTVKVTIALSKSSVEFFKEKAEEHNTAYQKIIRRLLDSYVDRHKRPLTKR